MPSMHQLLLRVLLLAVFFNTCLGMPLHAVEHLHGEGSAVALTGVGLHAGEAAADAGDGATDDHGAPHSQCVWCASHAQLAAALITTDVAPLPAPEAAALFGAAAPPAFVPQPQRWRFAARDPPALS